MPYKPSTFRRRSSRERAQTIVEFAIVLPILMVVLIGLFEAGRMIFIYAAVTNASREAVRFASAIGYQDNTYNRKYQYCSAIRDMARRSAFFMNLQDTDIVIQYDHGPGSSAFDTCPAGVTQDPTVIVKMGKDRAMVTVTATYSPLTRLVPFGTRTITSSSARTILGYVQVYP